MHRPTHHRLIALARGDAPAELVLRNARVVNVLSGTIEQTDVAIASGTIVGLGRDYQGEESVDLNGAYVAPGLIDAHVHIESSLCLPPAFASAVVPRGVTTVVADPHEIANVCGSAGVRFMHEASRGLPLNVVLMAPSCVPATEMATTAARLDVRELAALTWPNPAVHGLAEVMNFPAVVGADPSLLAKVGLFRNKERPVDGHAPGLRGRELCAYAIAGIGSDHECTSAEEATEKLARGLYVLIREATGARNLHALLPAITPANARRVCFCTDDRQPADLLDVGSVDHMLRETIAFGIDPILALQMCTLNPAEWFGLHDRGAIAPGRAADLFVFDDLRKPLARQVYVAGRRVAKDGTLLGSAPAASGIPEAVLNTCRLDPDAVRLRIAATSRRVRVIGAAADQLVTEHLVLEAAQTDGELCPDTARDLLKMAVVERHGRNGNVGLGFIRGLGLRAGAIAGTVAHDHHNLVAIGCDDESIGTGVREVCAMGGGLVVAEGARVLARMPLPVAGLMSDLPIAEARRQYDVLLEATRRLGSPLHDPFMAMSFMALEVIPKLKLTDRGLVDVETFQLVDLHV